MLMLQQATITWLQFTSQAKPRSISQAKEYQQRALKITLDKLGPEHVVVATRYNNLASIYQDLGDLEQAKKYQQRALKIRLDKLGPEHVDVATSDNNSSIDDGDGSENGKRA